MMRITNLALAFSMAVTVANAQGDSLSRDTMDIWREANIHEVVVKGSLPKTRLKGDAQVTRITGTVLEKAGSSIDVLSRLPLVEAKGESVSVMGRGDATVFINGREVKDKKELSQLQSDRIARVEVVQTPGARYSASTKAVIRIYLKKAQGEGFSLDTETRYEYQYEHQLWENLAMNYRTGGFDLGVKLWGQRQAYGEDKTIIQTTYLDQKWIQTSDTRIRNNSWQFAPTLTLNWQIADDQFVGMRYSYYRLPKQQPHDSYLDTQISRDGVDMERSMAMMLSKFRMWNHATNLYYSGKAADWQIDVNADIYISGETSDFRTDETVESSNLSPQGGTGEGLIFTADNRTRNNFYAVKAMAAHPLWGGQVAFGTEDSYTHRINTYANQQHIVKDDDNKINERLLSGFAEYNRQIGKLFVNAGLRFEHTGTDYYEFGRRQDEQSKRYNDWFPSLSLSMPVAKIAESPLQMSLSYSRDIRRPDYSLLRSGIYYDNKYTLESGNPLLDPKYDDNINLNVAWKWLNMTAGLSRTKNEVTFFSEPYIDPQGVEHPEISYLHPIELETYNNWHVGITAAPSFGHTPPSWGGDGGEAGMPIWSPRLTCYLYGQNYHADTKDGKRLMNHPIANISLGNHIALPHGWHLDIDYNFQSQGHIGNIRLTGVRQDFNFSILKIWLQGKIETRLRLEDAFQQSVQKAHVYNGLRELEELRDARRHLTLSFRYKFNVAGSKYKGQGAGSSQKSRM